MNDSMTEANLDLPIDAMNELELGRSGHQVLPFEPRRGITQSSSPTTHRPSESAGITPRSSHMNGLNWTVGSILDVRTTESR